MYAMNHRFHNFYPLSNSIERDQYKLDMLLVTISLDFICYFISGLLQSQILTDSMTITASTVCFVLMHQKSSCVQRNSANCEHLADQSSGACARH